MVKCIISNLNHEICSMYIKKCLLHQFCFSRGISQKAHHVKVCLLIGMGGCMALGGVTWSTAELLDVFGPLVANIDRDIFAEAQKQAIITSLLQMCLFPRSCFTAVDAYFCAKMLYTMHSLKTPNFSSLISYDRVSNYHIPALILDINVWMPG